MFRDDAQFNIPDPTPDVIAIAATTSSTSSTSRLLLWIATRLAYEGRTVATVLVSQIPGDALLAGDALHPALATPLRWVSGAHAIVLATPMRLASYSGTLKVFLDALPPDALRNKLVLPIATGSSRRQTIPFDTALVPELTVLGARHVLPTVFVADCDVRGDEGSGAMLPILPRGRIERALSALYLGLRNRADRN